MKQETFAIGAVKIDQADMVRRTPDAKIVFERRVDTNVLGGKPRPGFALELSHVDRATGRALDAFEMTRHVATIEFCEPNANATNVLTGQTGEFRVQLRTFAQRRSASLSGFALQRCGQESERDAWEK